MRLTRSFYAKVFLMFVVTALALYSLNQGAISALGESEMERMVSDRLIETNLNWSGSARMAPDADADADADALRLQLLAAMRVAHADEVMVYTTPHALTPEEQPSQPAHWFPLPPALKQAIIRPAAPDEHFPRIARALISIDGANWNATSLITPGGQIVSLVKVAVTDRYMAEFLDFRRRMIRKVMPVTLTIFILCTFFMTRRVLAPIKRIQDSLRSLDYRDLSVRIPVRGEDKEFREFIEAFNSMLERLERGFLQASRFSSDAAHELRTPLTIMQGYVERALIESEPGSRQQVQLRLVCDEIDRLANITHKLLLLAQADAGRLPMDTEKVDVSEMLEEMRADMAMIEPRLETRGRIEPGLCLQTDLSLFQQMLNNLFSNAVKYNDPAGWIDISAWAADGQLHIRFINPTAPLPAGFESTVFERFSRGDAAHSRRIDGTGLGLSLSREIAAANGGKLTFSVRHRSEVSVEFVTRLAGA